MPLDSSETPRPLRDHPRRAEVIRNQPQDFAIKRTGYVMKSSHVRKRIQNRRPPKRWNLTCPIIYSIRIIPKLEICPVEVRHVLRIGSVAAGVLSRVEQSRDDCLDSVHHGLLPLRACHIYARSRRRVFRRRCVSSQHSVIQPVDIQISSLVVVRQAPVHHL